MKKNSITTLNQFISDQQNMFPFVQGSLSRIFRDLQLGAKMINRDVRQAGLIDILGDFGNTNVQGEEQKKVRCYLQRSFYQIT
jgi:fructose-1,6-bisphosphatase I